MIEIREARPEELDEVGALTLRSYVESGAIDEDREYTVDLRDAEGRAADSIVLVASLDGEIVGTVTWCPPPSGHREVARSDDEGEFRMLAVPPEHAGRGIGRTMVRHVLGLAEQADMRRVVLCSATGMAAAHHLYPALGFVRDPERDWSPAPGIDLLAYRYDLRPGN